MVEEQNVKKQSCLENTYLSILALRNNTSTHSWSFLFWKIHYSERNEQKVNDIWKMILCVKGLSKGENTIGQSVLKFLTSLVARTCSLLFLCSVSKAPDISSNVLVKQEATALSFSSSIFCRSSSSFALHSPCTFCMTSACCRCEACTANSCSARLNLERNERKVNDIKKWFYVSKVNQKEKILSGKVG